MFIEKSKLNLPFDNDYVSGIDCCIQFAVVVVDKNGKIISGTNKTFSDDLLNERLLNELISRNKEAIETVVFSAHK